MDGQPRRVWVDGHEFRPEPSPGRSGAELLWHRSRRITRRFGLPRLLVSSLLRCAPDPSAPSSSAKGGLRVQVELGGELPGGYLGLHCARTREGYEGLFFDLLSEPSGPAPSEISTGERRRFGDRARLAIDGHLAGDAFVELDYERLATPPRGPWVRGLLRLRLAPGALPSCWLATLCQPRPGRRLVLGGAQPGSTLVLEAPRVVRASLIAPTERPFEPDPAGVRVEIELESRAPHTRERCPDLDGFTLPDLQVAPRANRDVGTVALSPEPWLRQALDRRRAFGRVARRLADELDRGLDGRSEGWIVLGDLLRDRGDPRAEALSAALRGQPLELERLGLSPAERELHGATAAVGGRFRVDGGEWSPRVWGAWLGPFLTHLAVEPGWTRIDRSEEGPGAGELIDGHGWHQHPGLLAYPELEAMFELPCCALLSPRRILLAGDSPPPRAELPLADNERPLLAGLDLRGVRLRNAALERADLRRCNLAHARLVGCSLREARLGGAILDHARFAHVSLEHADLSGVSSLEARFE